MSGHRFEFHNVPHNLKQLVLLQSTEMSYIELTHLRGSFILATKMASFPDKIQFNVHIEQRHRFKKTIHFC